MSNASRPFGFAVVTLLYAATGLFTWLVVVVLLPGRQPLLLTLYADVAATLLVFAAATAAENASLYDPYWSVVPAVIVVVWILTAGGGTARQLAVLLLVAVWAVRLTANWARSWQGLTHEDWRYEQLREDGPPGVPFWLVNLVGIHLVPTLVVFGGLLAVWPAVTVTDRGFGLLDVLAVLVTAAAILIETTADRQLHRFAAEPGNRGRIIDEGLWQYSRHPNYLGEILFWWGLWLFGLAAAPSWWWTVIGPIGMVLLFVFVSVPMMDRRSLARRPDYARHMRRVPALLPRRPAGDDNARHRRD
ncbi:DUF1295 domain-containing protein [Actinoplanes couchii]|uniref:Steroid 5-alpha reductase C-terminal domain-containing protein n=1 Tax=Actinoplanes couchii TaxID=403638 RepID=A0ABQ3XKB6_9ACTN|nr:DUF1295 domain-containing protein [Actinoplanes couchii]MDR6320542.1 steroid 5-alpha reductase family enzyme [Actinoplanes couchii]GID58946.1 hypothetical protein Aco03nite_073500 [Actinoplanes couchii]